MKIEVIAYNPHWPDMFEGYKSRIDLAIGRDLISIEHIGSTSVPGLAAKPVIDIQVGVKNAEILNRITPLMQKAGFTYMQKYEHLLPARRYFVLYQHSDQLSTPNILREGQNIPHDFVNLCHIHCWVHDGIDCLRHLAFRDYLRTHDDIRSEYQTLKQELSQQEWQSSLEYSQAKNDFIKAIEKRALDWYKSK